MFTRQQYLNDECTHDEYYSQYCIPEQIKRVRAFLSLYGDREIPLRAWDSVGVVSPIGYMMKINGDYLTLAGQVCINKQCAKLIGERHARSSM